MTRQGMHGLAWEGERMYQEWKDRMAKRIFGNVLVPLMIAAGWVMISIMSVFMWVTIRWRDLTNRSVREPAGRQ